MTFDPRRLALLKDVDVQLTVELGRASLKLRDLASLGEDSIVTLDRLADEQLDVLVNGTLIARGEVVTVGERFGLRITELVSRGDDDSEAA